MNEALPKRTADTMSDAIALSSPSGSMSKRARRAAEKRLHKALFGEGKYDLKGTPTPQHPSIGLRRRAGELRALADRGMNAKKFRAEADRLEAEAEQAGKDGD